MKSIDYKQVYNRFLAHLQGVRYLGERTPDFSAEDFLFMSKLAHWTNENKFCYSYTISPKSSPKLKNKTLQFQYDFLSNSVKDILSKYDCNYYFVFEIYSDNENMHMHGFITFPTASSITSIKKEMKMLFGIKSEKGKKDRLNLIKSMGHDQDLHQRWTGYCYKELIYGIKNGYKPIYRYNELYRTTNTVIAKKDILPDCNEDITIVVKKKKPMSNQELCCLLNALDG